ncbi:CoA transferase [Dactylosporangium sp. NPDC051485]|uniref:CaiB/BaiF CoA transferase family protein n=1 Tax=Dactylosporangium sp. NPDC051485 TaxID=3154846 RepID=UPI003420501D
MTSSNLAPDEHGGALAGVVVADFSRVLAGPMASMMLADLGATVVKVERPGSGDDTRTWGPPYVGTMSTYYSSVNRNKRSVTLDLDDPADLDLARRLVARADVFLENFRPGRLAAFGLDADTLLAAHPGLVYCSITGFGSGAGADRAGYDFVAQAVGGLMSITGAPGGEPTKVGVAIVDVITGLHATIAILAALRHRERTGAGQRVEVNLLSSLLASLANQGAAYINKAGVPVAMANRHPSIAPYETVRTKDAPLALAVGNDRQFAALCGALDRAELATDARFATNRERVVHRAELIAELEAAFVGDTAQGWAALLQARGVPCGPVNDLAGAFDLAGQLGLDPVATLPGSGGIDIATLASPLRLAATPVRYHRAPPELGADSADVRRWLESC